MGNKNVELKYIDKSLVKGNLPIDTIAQNQVLWTSAAGAQLAGAAPFDDNDGFVCQSLISVAQGQTASQRIGRKWTIKSIRIQLGLSLLQQGPTTSGGLVRLVVFWDKQCNGSVVSMPDLFEGGTTGADGPLVPGTNTQNYRLSQLPNVSNSQRFRFLVDKTYSFVGASNGTDGGGYLSVTLDKMINVYKKLNLEIESSATSSVLAGIRSNNIGMALLFQGTGPGVDAVTPPDAGATRLVVIPWGTVRARYTDA